MSTNNNSNNKDNSLNKKEKWSSDKEDKKYYQNIWNETCKKADLSEEINYINVIYSHIDDANNCSRTYQNRWKLSEYLLIILAAIVAFFNTVAATFTDDAVISFSGITIKYTTIFNLVAAAIAVAVSILNGIKVIASYKETWLRHSKFRSELVMECHNFATNSGDYTLRDDEKGSDSEKKYSERKIANFKSNTTKIIQEDYNRFFSNMSKD